jgi:flagella basal body P-ring formation protein FlgA
MRYNIVLFIFCLALFSLAAHTAQAASLKTQSIVSDDVIRLGDLFSGLEYNQDRVLGASPRPGEDMVLNAQTLMRVAVAMDLDWRPGSNQDYLVVKRAATLVDAASIEKGVRKALNEEGVTGAYNLMFQTGNPQIVLPPDFAPNFEVANMRYDADNSWFEADIFAPSANDPHTQLRVSGKVETLVQVPVLKDSLRTGSVIRADDIEVIDVPAHSLNHDVILSAQDLIDQTPRRMIVAGKPIKTRDVESPRVVSRGDSVTMIYETGVMRLTAIGKAMENGSEGDTVRVVNDQSKRSVEAIVTGQQEVTVKF